MLILLYLSLLLHNSLANSAKGELDFCSKGKCYAIFPQTLLSFSDSKKLCIESGRHMLTIQDEEEMNTIMEYIKEIRIGSIALWLGYTDIKNEGNFVDEVGNSMGYSNWYKTEPSATNILEDCVGMDIKTGKWFDYICFALLPFICQYPQKTDKTNFEHDLTDGIKIGLKMTTTFDSNPPTLAVDNDVTTCAISKGNFLAGLNYSFNIPVMLSEVIIHSGRVNLERPRYFDIFAITPEGNKISCGKVTSDKLPAMYENVFSCTKPILTKTIMFASYIEGATLSFCEVRSKYEIINTN